MDASLFKRFCSIAHEKAGIHLRPGKEALVASRVQKRLRALALDCPRSYLEYLEADESGHELVHFLDVISTNFTSFFREREHFDLLAAQVKQALADGHQRLRYWSAASSSGEEPYSMLITILEALAGQAVDLKILATDISTKVLLRAKAGNYDQKTVAPLSRAQRQKYFVASGPTNHRDTTFEARPQLKDRVAFARLNLAAPPFPMTGPFDLIFCRNVMIYFDRDARQNLVGEIERLLPPGGMLFTGHSETLAGLDTQLSAVKPSVYQKTTTSGDEGIQ